MAVVGGGIAGLSAALPLAQAGRKVAVLEARKIGRQVTGRSTAKITTQHGLIYDYLIRKLGRDEATLYAEANKAGMAQILDWISAFDVGCSLERKSAYTYIGPERESLDALNQEVEAALSLGLPADFVDRAPLPFATGGAVRFTDQAQFNPMAYLVGLAQAVADAGGAIYEKTRVTALDDGEPRKLTTTGGEIEADQVYLATNLPVAGPDDYSHRTQPRYHVAMAFRVAPADAPDGMFIAAEDPVHSFRTGWDGEGPLLVVLGPHFNTGQEGDVAGQFHELEAWARLHFKLGKAVWRWCNEDYDTAARVPFVGAPAGDGEGLYIATGFNAWGISNGTAAGLLVADSILGRENDWSEVFNPARHSPKDFHKSGKSQSHVAWVAEISAGCGGVVEAGDEKIAVWRDEQGALHAFSAKCTHKGCPVTWNNAEHTWDCPCPGSIFDADGSVIHGPAVEPLAATKVPD